MSKSAGTPLEIMKAQLKELSQKRFKQKYYVPSLWTEAGKPLNDGKEAVEVNPGEFFLKHIEAIEKHRVENIDPLKSLNSQIKGGKGGSWINDEAIYNMFVRLTAAFDHNQDGSLGGDSKDITLDNGIRESGTFLKAIAMLGYIKSLGCSVIHLLPITSIGHDGNKGELGSPYAIKNPYKIEETLADPLLGMSAEEQFKAFIEACHIMGIRVICEFVFRTASKDSDIIAEHPDWVYWIDEKVQDRKIGETDPDKIANTYGNPVFESQDLHVINSKVAAHDFNDLPAPSSIYRNFFKLAPEKKNIKLTKEGKYTAKAKDPVTKKMCDVRIPGAFADWPPDDNQPPWGDVTYLKMYKDENSENPEFNYIAYNTIRMYDNKLAQPELANAELWEYIIDLIPTYQTKYGIDGVMVDMGHAVPVELMRRLIEKARKTDPNFCFLSENFEITQSSVDAGYNAVVGYSWWVEYRRDGMYDMLEHLGSQGVPLAFFGAVENHNTPRAAARAGKELYSKYAFLVNTMLPHSIVFIHSGQELGETMPVNTGLDFSNEDLKSLSGKKLALFDLCAYNWNGNHEMLGFMQKVIKLRKEFGGAVLQKSPESFCKLLTGHSDVIAFIRRGEGTHVMVLFNRDFENALGSEIDLHWCLPTDCKELKDQISGKTFEVKYQKLKYNLMPGEAVLLAW